MNPISSLNLLNHDVGIASISTLPVALDWLAKALPTSPQRQAHPSRGITLPCPPANPLPQLYHGLPLLPFSSSLAMNAGGNNSPFPKSENTFVNMGIANPPHGSHFPNPLPGTLPNIVSRPLPPFPALGHLPLLPSIHRVHNPLAFGIGGIVGITKKQASAALVRHVRPYGRREVLVPCFAISNRYILGRLLGSLHVPTELGLTQLSNEQQYAEARFVLDLHHGSIVEFRHYASCNVVLCVGYAGQRVEFVVVPPSHFARTEISYSRDIPTSSHMDPILSAPSTSDIGAQQYQNMRFGIGQDGYQDIIRPNPEQIQPLPRMEETLSGRFQHQYQPYQQPEESSEREPSWHDFCIKFGQIFPTGPLLATITFESQETNPQVIQKKESIIATINDEYATTFCFDKLARPRGTSVKRIAKRLLPRPTP